MKIEIEIVKDEAGQDFNVQFGDRFAKHLTFDEMLGTVAAIGMPESRPCLAWLKTQEQWDAHEAWLNGLKPDDARKAEFESLAESIDIVEMYLDQEADFLAEECREDMCDEDRVQLAAIRKVLTAAKQCPTFAYKICANTIVDVEVDA